MTFKAPGNMILEAEGTAAFVSGVKRERLPGPGMEDDSFLGDEPTFYRLDVDDTVTWHIVADGALVDVSEANHRFLERMWKELDK